MTKGSIKCVYLRFGRMITFLFPNEVSPLNERKFTSYIKILF